MCNWGVTTVFCGSVDVLWLVWGALGSAVRDLPWDLHCLHAFLRAIFSSNDSHGNDFFRSHVFLCDAFREKRAGLGERRGAY